MEELLTATNKFDYPLVIIILIWYAYNSHKDRKKEIERLRQEIISIQERFSQFKSNIIKQLLEQTNETTQAITELSQKLDKPQ